MSQLAERLKHLASRLFRSTGRRVRTPTVLQMEAVECGAAALAIILAYFGRVVPLEKLRVACDVNRNGVKASNMVRAASMFGLKCKGFRKTPETIRALPLPLIIHWNFDHFLVLEGFGRNRVYLNDPARGRYSVLPLEFDEAFTGVVLAFEKTREFESGSEKEGLIPALARRMAGSKRALLFVLMASLGLVVPGLAIPTFTTVFVDRYLVQRLSDQVMPLFLLMGLVMMLNVGFTWLQQRYLLRLQTKLAVSTSSAFLWHVLHLPVEFFTQRMGGEVASRVGINDRVANLISGTLATTLLGVITAAFYLSLMVLYDPVLTLVALATAVLNIFLLRVVSGHRVDANRRLLQDQGKLAGTTQSGLQMIETLKAAGAESDFYQRWAGFFGRALSSRQELGLKTRALNTAPTLLAALNTTAILSVGALRVMDGAMTIGMLVAFQFLVGSFLAPVRQLVGFGSELQTAEGDLNRLDDVLRHEKAPGLDHTTRSDGPAWAGPPKLRGALELRSITFGYSRQGDPLIENFSMRLEPGSWVALAGRSGCGKSTLARIVSGLHEPWSGEVLLDGVPRSQIPRNVLSDSISLVDQDVVLFSDTVRANLTLWDETVPASDLERAASDARVHELIMSRQGGYSGAIAERGNDLSGGQRQRLELARALASSPSILLLDEATSALDATTEREVMDALRRRGCACLVIAHRLSTIRDCDEIIVLDQGCVVERGTHETLMAGSGHYRQLIEDQ